MTLLLTSQALVARRSAVQGPLQPLAASLAADLEPLLAREIYFPAQKALLSRQGGRCARDGTLLEFRPFEPHEHRCPRCGEVYRGEVHDRFWIYWYQLWLAERAVHGAALAALGAGERFSTLAEQILDGYALRYLMYPNIDNVLGPTRLFFSTYLESIWLLQICVAIDLLRDTRQALAGRVCDRVIQPSRAIIAEYDEGGSNRQVWNDVALLAAGLVLHDERAVENAVNGKSGIATHLGTGLLSDGTWFEGENYHLFAHRGLWYGVTMAEQADLALPAPLVARFQRGFATPFATALPDLTLPSRRDSQYAISLRQWRIAEHLELGAARTDEPELFGHLARLYEAGVPRRDTGRSTSSADVERNQEPTALTRADLSWRALLCARQTLPHLEPIAPRSALLGAQGVAVFRRNAATAYAMLDFGESGGGHGHPDRLNLLLADGETRWLDDYGTGSYVDPSLHWYRSTLAHNAPLVDGRSQARVTGALRAYDERGPAGWVVATADGIASGVTAERVLVVLPGYCIDSLSWSAERNVVLDLPIHADLELDGTVGELEPAEPRGGAGLEDGFEFIRDAGRQLVSAGTTVHARAVQGDRSLELWSRSDSASEWWRATAPGPPSRGERTFRFIRARGYAGQHVTVMTWCNAVADVAIGQIIRVLLRDGTVHTHRRADSGWVIELETAGGRSRIDLDGHVAGRASEMSAGQISRRPPAAITLVRGGRLVSIDLDAAHYRRTEQTWPDAGRPTARVTLRAMKDSLHLEVDVPNSDLTFVRAGAENPFDNEPADINGDGVQLYLRNAEVVSGWMLVPDPDSTLVRSRPIEGSRAPLPGAGARLEIPGAPLEVRAAWQARNHGYRMQIDVQPIPEMLDVVINEMPRGRVRRRGQMVMSGAGGEFAYLRGDRHEEERMIRLHVTDA
jgi:hypothetical protein